LPLELKIKPKGGIKLKNPFKRTKPDKPDQGPDVPANYRCPMSIPTMKQLTPPLDDLGLSFQVGYDHNFRGTLGAWYLTFMPSYSWKCHTLGLAAVAVVNRIGLEFSRDVNYSIRDDGKIIFTFQERPTDAQVFAIIKETGRQITDILKRYRETEIMMKISKNA
jgi:hypothetical protein